jgi:hypothetical protein
MLRQLFSLTITIDEAPIISETMPSMIVEDLPEYVGGEVHTFSDGYDIVESAKHRTLVC